jgi:hypothetical protein
METRHHSGTGWIVTSAILLIVAGGSILINGLWALHANNAIQNTVRGTLLFSESNLDTWGWIYTITGIVLVAVGIAVFWRATWAVVLGVAAACVGILLACLWLFTPYWPDALISILLNGIVLFGLGTYGFDHEAVGA